MKHISRSVPLVLLVGSLHTAACSPMGMATTALDLTKAKSTFDEMQDFRRQKSSLAGLWRIEYNFEGEKPIAVFVRTLENKNVPLGSAKEQTLADRLNPRSGVVEFNGYMTQALGARQAHEVPDTIARGLPIAGFLVVTDSLNSVAPGSTDHAGYFALKIRDEAEGELAHLRQLIQTRLGDQMDVTEARFTRSPSGPLSGRALVREKDGRIVRITSSLVDDAAFQLGADAYRDRTISEIYDSYGQSLKNEIGGR